MKKSKLLAAEIIDKFEDLLEKYNITIPSDDRSGDEAESRFYGTEYFNMQDEVEEMILNFVDNKNKVSGELGIKRVVILRKLSNQTYERNTKGFILQDEGKITTFIQKLLLEGKEENYIIKQLIEIIH